ncbi:MAG: hypothetical protein IT343_12135 [Candidatus Melainabacteria bacterium]|nr:hypothetical protein [Candidatus Melainabacteria bacterium]
MKTVVKNKIIHAGALPAVLLALLIPVNPAFADSSPKKLFRFPPSGKIAQAIRQADFAPARDKLISQPGESHYFPTTADGTPIVLELDTTVNFTESLNRFYYEPKWRGEVWVPFNQWSLIERATRLMSTWPEYDEFSQYRKLNHVHKFFERYSGFGP